MSVLIFIVAVAVIVAAVVFLAGRAMGPTVVQRKFDETPADVIPMDVSDGTPLDLKPLAISDDVWIPERPRTIPPEEIAAMERFGEALRAGRLT